MKLPTITMFGFVCISASALLWAHATSEIELTAVPAKVIQAAQNAKPGVNLTEFEKIDNGGKTSYELEGSLGEEYFEFLISEEGVLLELEAEDDD